VDILKNEAAFGFDQDWELEQIREGRTFRVLLKKDRNQAKTLKLWIWGLP